MSSEDTLLLASWIVKGELGLLEERKTFRWVGQAEVSLHVNVGHVLAKYVSQIVVSQKGRHLL